MASGEKTEAPTPKRREEVRKKGMVPKSVELSGILTLIAAVFVLKNIGGSVLLQMLDLMTNSFRNLSSADWTPSSMASYGSGLGMVYLSMMAPLFVAVTVVGVAGNFAQVGAALTTKPLSPDFSRIDPFKGLKRMLSQRSIVEFVKSLARLGVVGFIVFQALQDKYLRVVNLSGSDIHGTAVTLADGAIEVLLKSSLALLALAAMDYAYQRWEYERNIRMTKDEIREEQRQTEGDPKIRSRIRQQQRQMATRRMMQDVPKSDVVLTNPTHLAVALQYRPESMRSPKVVAKGQLLVAERIKEMARQHGVPVMENQPLAQALFKAVEVGAEIPPALYQAVAEILAFIYSLKRATRLGGHSVGS